MISVRCVGVTVAVAAFLGCGSHPIPTSIVEGTSGTITLITDLEVGYGLRMAGLQSGAWFFNSGHPDEDIQRGEMILTLVDESGPSPVDVTRLPVRFITRAEIDSASTEATSTESTGTKTQVVIVFDVPPGLVDDAPPGYKNFGIRVERWRRDMDHANKAFEKLSVFDTGTTQFQGVGWGSRSTFPTALIPITVVDDPAVAASEPSVFAGTVDPEPAQIGPTERTGWGAVITCEYGACGATFSEQIYFNNQRFDYVPNPEFTIRIGGTCSACVPAAWEFDVDYPSDRVSIVNVSLDRKMKDQAYLDWEAPESTGGCTSPHTTQTANIRIADRDALARGVRIAFRLRNIDDANCQTPISATDFVVSPVSAYDANGETKTFPTLELDASG